MKPIGSIILAAIITPLIALGIAVAVFLNTKKPSTDFDTLFYLCLALFIVIVMLFNGLIVGLAHRNMDFRKKILIWVICMVASLIGYLIFLCLPWGIELVGF